LSASAGNVDDMPGVRSTDARILALVREAAARSATLRTLVDAIAASKGIVSIEFGDCAFGHLNACLLPFVASLNGDRYLRIVVTPDSSRRSRDHLLALMAHELRHALEVLDRPEIVDAAAMEALYRRIGTPMAGLDGYETSAALAAGDAAFAELRKKPLAGGSPTIDGALALFSPHELATMPRIELSTVQPEGATQDTEGYVAVGYPVIYIATWSEAYRAATAGDRGAMVKLAGIIAHERVHVEQGMNERPAYEAEILMLRRGRAASAVVDGVRRAMQASLTGRPLEPAIAPQLR
jgi:hypothetical protein